MSDQLSSKISEINTKISDINKEILLLKRKIDNYETERIGLILDREYYEEALLKDLMNNR